MKKWVPRNCPLCSPTFYLWKGWFGIPDQNKTSPKSRERQISATNQYADAFPIYWSSFRKIWKNDKQYQHCLRLSHLAEINVKCFNQIYGKISNNIFLWYCTDGKIVPYCNLRKNSANSHELNQIAKRFIYLLYLILFHSANSTVLKEQC